MVYSAAFSFGQFGYASTVAVVLMAVVLIVAVIQFRLAGGWRAR
jgi:ABC-type sugar transport system permease subunit